ncbi:hypothetical protein [Carboxylicivirga caseinilyticus]|uniref:hypothetical protein n=1 Tax=Carboxylicivirga caseinilyticus TaxID=3417572 RepID=UPI003D3433DE|nr:hypothetical protein [Marinilabiliaceae bacterium A049]
MTLPNRSNHKLNIDEDMLLDKKQRRYVDLIMGKVKPENEEERKMLKEIEDTDGIPYIPTD